MSASCSLIPIVSLVPPPRPLPGIPGKFMVYAGDWWVVNGLFQRSYCDKDLSRESFFIYFFSISNSTLNQRRGTSSTRRRVHHSM